MYKNLCVSRRRYIYLNLSLGRVLGAREGSLKWLRSTDKIVTIMIVFFLELNRHMQHSIATVSLSWISTQHDLIKFIANLQRISFSPKSICFRETEMNFLLFFESLEQAQTQDCLMGRFVITAASPSRVVFSQISALFVIWIENSNGGRRVRVVDIYCIIIGTRRRYVSIRKGNNTELE